jgi:uncharacterized protein
MKKKSLVPVIVLLSILAVFSLNAQEVKFPSPRGHVNDYAGIISDKVREQLEKMLIVVENKTSAEMAILTVNSTAPLTIEQYAVELFQDWGIGKKGKDNGVLLIVAKDDRKVRIEVGYGLEGALTDVHSKIIINDLMTPHFKAGNYEAGITAGAVMIVKVIANEYGVDLDLKREAAELTRDMKEKEREEQIASVISTVIVLGFIILIFIQGRRARKSGGYWSSGAGGAFSGGFGDSGGGFGGFGGGSSGGGGASGSW